MMTTLPPKKNARKVTPGKQQKRKLCWPGWWVKWELTYAHLRPLVLIYNQGVKLLPLAHTLTTFGRLHS